MPPKEATASKSAPAKNPPKKDGAVRTDVKKGEGNGKATPRANPNRFLNYVGGLSADELKELEDTIATFKRVKKAAEKGAK